MQMDERQQQKKRARGGSGDSVGAVLQVNTSGNPVREQVGGVKDDGDERKTRPSTSTTDAVERPSSLSTSGSALTKAGVGSFKIRRSSPSKYRVNQNGGLSGSSRNRLMDVDEGSPPENDTRDPKGKNKVLGSSCDTKLAKEENERNGQSDEPKASTSPSRPLNKEDGISKHTVKCRLTTRGRKSSEEGGLPSADVTGDGCGKTHSGEEDNRNGATKPSSGLSNISKGEEDRSTADKFRNGSQVIYKDSREIKTTERSQQQRREVHDTSASSLETISNFVQDDAISKQALASGKAALDAPASLPFGATDQMKSRHRRHSKHSQEHAGHDDPGDRYSVQKNVSEGGITSRGPISSETFLRLPSSSSLGSRPCPRAVTQSPSSSPRSRTSASGSPSGRGIRTCDVRRKACGDDNEMKRDRISVPTGLSDTEEEEKKRNGSRENGEIDGARRFYRRHDQHSEQSGSRSRLLSHPECSGTTERTLQTTENSNPHTVRGDKQSTLPFSDGVTKVKASFDGNDSRKNGHSMKTVRSARGKEGKASSRGDIMLQDNQGKKRGLLEINDDMSMDNETCKERKLKRTRMIGTEDFSLGTTGRENSGIPLFTAARENASELRKISREVSDATSSNALLNVHRSNAQISEHAFDDLVGRLGYEKVAKIRGERLSADKGARNCENCDSIFDQSHIEKNGEGDAGKSNDEKDKLGMADKKQELPAVKSKESDTGDGRKTETGPGIDLSQRLDTTERIDNIHSDGMTRKPAGSPPARFKTSAKNKSKSRSNIKGIKMKLFMAGSKVHRGEGAERLFSDYWAALGRYLSCGSQTRNSTSKSNNCVETTLKAFLTTRTLRRLHNELILAIMKKSLHIDVPERYFRRCIPIQWKERIQIKSSVVPLTNMTRAPSSANSGAPSDRTTLNSDVTTERNEIRKDSVQQRRPKDESDLQRWQRAFDVNSGVWTVHGHDHMEPAHQLHPETCSLKIPPQKLVTDDAISEMNILSAALPGALSIDPLIRRVAEGEGMAVSETAVWLMVVAVREYIVSVFKQSVSDVETVSKGYVQPLPTAPMCGFSTAVGSQKRASSKSNSSGSTLVAGSKKRRLITSLDMAHVFATNPVVGGRSFGSSSSRLAFERCMSGAGDKNLVHVPHGLATLQACINKEIENCSIKRQRVDFRGTHSPSEPSNLTGRGNRPSCSNAPGYDRAVIMGSEAAAVMQGGGKAIGDAHFSKSDHHADRKPPPQAFSQRTGRGGKDVAALKMRTAPPSAPSVGNMPNEGPGGPIRCRTDGTTSLDNQYSSFHGRGRGCGVKNLAAMRARTLTPNSGQDSNDPRGCDHAHEGVSSHVSGKGLGPEGFMSNPNCERSHSPRNLYPATHSIDHHAQGRGDVQTPADQNPADHSTQQRRADSGHQTVGAGRGMGGKQLLLLRKAEERRRALEAQKNNMSHTGVGAVDLPNPSPQGKSDHKGKTGTVLLAPLHVSGHSDKRS